MENNYNEDSFVFEDKDFDFFAESKEVAEDIVLEDIVAEEVIEQPVVEEVVEPVSKKKKSSKNEKVVYATKDVAIAGIEIPKGYSKVSQDLVAEVIKHPKVRIASEDEIAKYL